VRCGTIGVIPETITPRPGTALGLGRDSDVAVAVVPAEYAGLNPGLVAGDVIYPLNTQPVASLGELRDALKAKNSGDPIALRVERDGQLIYVIAALE